MQMMDERIEKQLAFSLEIDKEKNIFRQTHISGHGRNENDAEHAWHMAIMAYLLREYANEDVDITKVMLMCLIHDIVEIDAGDTYAYDAEGLKTQKERENAAKERIFSLLPDDQKAEMTALFDEFEDYQTPEAKYAHAMDNLQPLILNNSNDGGDWREHGVSAKTVYGRQSKTRLGSKKLFEITDWIIQDNIRKQQAITWEQRKLDEFVSFFSGLTYSPADIRPAGTLVLRSSNVKDGEVVDADNVYVDPTVVNSENVRDGDIIVVVRNGSRALIGKHAEIKGFKPNTVIGAFMTGIRSEHPSFLNALLNTPRFDKEVEMNMGATINQITGYMFSKMEFMVPSSDEQDIIGNYFKKLDNLITLHQREDSNKKRAKIIVLTLLSWWGVIS